MTDEDRIGLREYMEALMAEHEKRQVEQVRATDIAMQLRATELERRLREEVVQSRSLCQTKELQGVFAHELEAWKRRVEDYMVASTTRTAITTGIVGVLLVAANIVVTVALFWMSR